MVNDRFKLCKRLLVFRWCLWMELIYITNKNGGSIRKYTQSINFIVIDGAHVNRKRVICLIDNVDIKLVLADE